MSEQPSAEKQRELAGPIAVAVSGGRDYSDERKVFATLDAIHKRNEIYLLIEGGCGRGADELARLWAKNREVNCLSIPAKWKKHQSRVAGPIRNREMAKCRIDLWVLFPGGPGTADAKTVAREAGIRTMEVTYDLTQ